MANTPYEMNNFLFVFLHIHLLNYLLQFCHHMLSFDCIVLSHYNMPDISGGDRPQWRPLSYQILIRGSGDRPEEKSSN